jgi:hypothetical protein
VDKKHTIRLKGPRAVDAVIKIANGQNTDDGGDDSHPNGYHLGATKWCQMAANRELVLNDRDLEFAIDVLENLRDAAMDNAQGNSYNGAEYRAEGKAYDRLRESLIKVQKEATR